MKIRTYAEKDKCAVIDLWQECELVFPQNDVAKDINHKLKVDLDLFIVGELSGVIVATVMGGGASWLDKLFSCINLLSKEKVTVNK